ncbi:MAG TPA: DUF2950 family protein [Planctomycetota bacterium]|nr:DUF2950 family protein [Planctomycetota bacterium]
MRARAAVVVAVFFALLECQAADAVSAEHFLPEETIVALVIPDLGAARAAAGKTRMAAMFNEPEMQAFLQPIQAELEKQYAAVRAQNPMVPAAEDINSALLSGELVVALCAFPNNPKKAQCIVATFRPKDAAAFERLLPEPLRQPVMSGQPLPLPNRKLRAQWVRDRLLFVSDAADFAEVAARLEKKAEKSIAALPPFAKAKGKFSDSAGWAYLSPSRLGAVVLALSEGSNADANKIKGFIQALGTDKMPAVVMSAGFSNGIPVVESSIVLDGPPVGVATLFLPPAQGAPDLDSFKFAAVDAPFVGTGYMNFAGALPLIRRALEAASPPDVEVFDRGMNEVQNVLGFDLQKDVLENIGAHCIVVQPAVDTGIPLSFMPGVTYVFPLKNGAKVEECLGKVGPALEKAPPSIKMQYRMRKTSYKNKNLHYLSGLLAPFPAVCCVAGDRLLVGTSVNAVKRTLDQLENKDNILSNKAFQDAIARVTGKPFDVKNLPLAIAYSRDESSGTGSLIMSSLYYLVGAGVTAGLAEIPTPNAAEDDFGADFEDEMAPLLRRPSGRVLYGMGMAVDLGLWPDESFFQKHRMPSAGYSVLDADGLFSRSELPAPAPVSSSSGTTLMVATATVAIVAAIAIPSLLRSRMAANQTAAAAHCKSYAEAQEIYRRTDYDGDGVLEYAQSLGGDNSLLEKTKGAGDLALVDKTFAMAEGNPSQNPVPRAGYCFKVLKAQGANATGGKRNFVVNGNMTHGYALVAYPAKYDGTGRDTFVISHNGTIFQKDMGPETPDIVEAMTEFDPDETWAAAE